MAHKKRYIGVFCGSRPGNDPAWEHVTRKLADTLVAADFGVVYGGGRVGLMGVLADSMIARGGDVVGVIPRGLARDEIAHTGLQALHVVESMHARKALMAQLACAFVALPGGFGTLDELFEIVTWAQIGLHDKPIGLLNAGGYFDALLTFVRHSVRAGFVPAEHAALLAVAPSPPTLLRALFSAAAARPSAEQPRCP